MLPHRPGEFLQKQGIPGGFRQEVLHQGLWHRRRVQHGLHHASTVCGTQPRQGKLGRIGLLHPRGPIARPEGHEQQERHAGQPLHQLRQIGLGGGIDPVQVLHHHQERLPLALLAQQLVQGGKGLGADLLGAAPDEQCRAVGHAEQVQQERRRLGGCHAHRLEMLLHVGGDRRRAVRLGAATGVPQEVLDGSIGGRLPVRHALPFQIR